MHGKVYAAKAHAFMEGLRQGAFFFSVTAPILLGVKAKQREY